MRCCSSVARSLSLRRALMSTTAAASASAASAANAALPLLFLPLFLLLFLAPRRRAHAVGQSSRRRHRILSGKRCKTRMERPRHRLLLRRLLRIQRGARVVAVVLVIPEQGPLSLFSLPPAPNLQLPSPTTATTIAVYRFSPSLPLFLYHISAAAAAAAAAVDW